MRVVTAEQMREMDRRTIASSAATGVELMDRAGRGLARSIRQICRWRGVAHPAIRMVAGKGNNGGDVFAAAYHLFRHFPDLEVVLVGQPDLLQGETLWHYERLLGHVDCKAIDDAHAWEMHAWYGGVDIVVDGLLGTGSKGAPREPIASAVRAIDRARREGALVVAVDMPSGVCADTGKAAGDAVVADFTITMGLPKVGMLQPEAQSFLGCVEVVDIGIVDEEKPLCANENPVCISGADVRQWLPPRARASHKGSHGKVLVIGGAPGYSGAIAMAVQAACRSGAGLVYVLTPDSVADRVAQLVPEAMVSAGKQRSDGGLAADALQDREGQFAGIDTILIGPGLTCHADGVQLIQDAYRLTSRSVVLDADALNLLGTSDFVWSGDLGKNVILTPHPGEAARLLGVSGGAIQADRLGSVLRLAEAYQAVSVLKGAGTLVSDRERCGVNLTGTPGMATGGSGDVLAGMIAALCAQAPGPWEAASAGVYVHGVAGNIAASEGSEVGMTAMDLLRMVPSAFGWVLGR